MLGGRSSPSDRDAPDVELTFQADELTVFVAYYPGVGPAVRYQPELAGGSVTRRGSVTVIWTGDPPAETRESVEACAFG